MIPAYIARTQLGTILKEIAQQKARFIITKSGKPTAVILSIADLDDMLEELDPEFQKSMTVAHQEYTSDKGITLQDYLRERITRRRTRV